MKEDFNMIRLSEADLLPEKFEEPDETWIDEQIALSLFLNSQSKQRREDANT